MRQFVNTSYIACPQRAPSQRSNISLKELIHWEKQSDPVSNARIMVSSLPFSLQKQARKAMKCFPAAIRSIDPNLLPRQHIGADVTYVGKRETEFIEPSHSLDRAGMSAQKHSACLHNSQQRSIDHQRIEPEKQAGQAVLRYG